MSDVMLKVSGLTVESTVAGRTVPLVEDVSFEVRRGKTLGIVGESGSGKSMTAAAILGSLPLGVTARGSIRYNGNELVGMPQSKLRKLRGSEIATILQDPLSALDPVFTIKSQLVEPLKLHRRDVTDRHEEARALLEHVGLADPQRALKSYPHQLSGGMRQRVVGAIAMAGHPRLLLADEPTTALDVTIQARYLDLIEKLTVEHQLATILISHDFAVINRLADEVVVLYAGRVLEAGPTAEVLAAPRHPYTEGLCRSVARLGTRPERLFAIPGAAPEPAHRPTGCPFHPRCGRADVRCRSELPVLEEHGDVVARCFHPGPATDVSWIDDTKGRS